MCINHKKDDLEKIARAKLIKLGKANNLYFVVWNQLVWNQHFGKTFFAIKNISKKPTEIYSAIYESFNDLTKDDEEMFNFSLGYTNSWESILHKALSYFPREFRIEK